MASPFVVTRLAAFALLAAASFSPEIARADELEADVEEDEAEEDPAEEKKRDDADRAHVSGGEEGSLKKPIRLLDEARAARLCADVQGARGRDDEDATELRAKKRVAMRDVYAVTVGAGGFKVGEYRRRAGRLPLRLEHPLIALDGAVRLIVVDKAGGAFEIAAKDAAAVARDVEEKRLALEVVFRVDPAMADSMSPCFSYPKSAAYALNVEPLEYALVEVGTNARRAAAKTPALARLERWMNPGRARLSIAVHAEGPADPAALTGAVEAKRAELEACFGKVMQSPSDSGVLAFEGTVTPAGALADVRIEAEAIEDAEAAGACVKKVLASVAGPKAPRASRAHLAFSIERGEDGPPAANN